MVNIVQTRLDDETKQILERLIRFKGTTASGIVREALRLLDSVTPAGNKKRIIGIGKFNSGIADLGSNKQHLKGFGA